MKSHRLIALGAAALAVVTVVGMLVVNRERSSSPISDGGGEAGGAREIESSITAPPQPGRVRQQVTTDSLSVAGEHFVVLATGALGRRVAGRVFCHTCQLTDHSDGGHAAHLLHRLGGELSHSLRVSAPGYQVEEVEVLTAALESGVMESTVLLEPTGQGRMVVYADSAETLQSVNVRARYSPRFGEDVYGGYFFVSAPASWSREDCDLGVRVSRPVAALQRFQVLVDWGGDVVDFGPFNPRGDAVIDLRTSGSRVQFVADDGNEEVPVEGVLVEVGSGAGSGTSVFRRSGADGFIALPPSNEGICLLQLGRETPYRFEDGWKVDGGESLSAAEAVIDPRHVSKVVLRRIGWRLILLDDATSEPIRGEAEVVVELLPSGERRWHQVDRFPARGIGRRGYEIAASFSGSDAIRSRMRVTVPGYLPGVLDLTMSTVEQLRQRDGVALRLRPASQPYQLQFVRDWGLWAGQSCAVFFARDHAPIAELRLGSDGLSEEFFSDSGRVVLELGGGSFVREIDLPVGDPGVREVVAVEIEGRHRIVVRRGAGDFLEEIYVAGRTGGLVAMEENVDGAGGWELRVMPGRYVVGPLQWVLNERQRLRYASFGLHVETDDVVVDWDERWSLPHSIRGRVDCGSWAGRVELVPVYMEGDAYFIPEIAQHVIALDGAGEYVLEAGEPMPSALIVVVDMVGVERGWRVPVDVLGPGEIAAIDFGYLNLSPDVAALAGLREGLLLDVKPRRLLDCLRFAFDAREVALSRVGGRVGPVPLSSARISVLDGQHRTTFYPSSSSDVGVVAERE